MAESSSHNHSSSKITPKEEHVTLDRPESQNPFLPTDQIKFSFIEIALTTNNEVALLYPSHSSSEYFRETLDNSKIWVSTPTGGIRGDVGYSREIGAKGTLKKSFLPPRVKVDYAKLIWEDIIHKLNKKTREKVVPYPRFISLLLEYMMPEYENEELTINPTQVFSVHNWALKPNQTEGPPFTDHMKAICNLDVPVDSKAPKPSSQTEEVPQGKKPGAKSGLKRKQSSKHTSESKTEASKSKTGQSEKETQSSSAKDKSPSHPSPPTPVVGEMHKEAQQAAGGPTSLGATSEEGAHPQLSSGHDASADSTAEADPRNSAPNDSIPSQQDQTKSAGDGLKTAHTDSCINEESRADHISKKIKLEDLSDLLKDTRSAFFTPDSPQDEPIIILDESEEEEEVSKDKDTHASSHNARPSYLDINQLTDLLATSLKTKLSKLLASHDFAIFLPNALKELPSKFTKLSAEIKELKKHVLDMEFELPGDLKEIPTKLETFTSIISSLSSQVAELNNIQWELPMEFQALLSQFATIVENASGATTKDVPLASQATTSPAEGEKNTNPATTDAEPNLHDELVDLLGIDVVTQYYNKKLLYDKYYDQMLKSRKISKITNCNILTQKGFILLKVHREDGTNDVISNVKFGDLHLAEWKEVVQACPDRKEKGWKTIYGFNKTKNGIS
ncbi:hypothetical protein Tco_0439015 [Tanacetum coccineum]